MDSLYKGIIKRKKDQVEFPIIVRRLTSNDLSSILQVQKKVLESLEKKDILQPLTKAEFQYILDGNGFMIGAFIGPELISFRALLVPPIDEEHLGLDVGLPETELPKVIYQEISNVLPEYRGNQLQKKLARLIMVELEKENHHYRYICCTVAPFNIPSLKDKFSQGMQIRALNDKHGGLLRYVFFLDLTETEPKKYNEIIPVKMGETAAQQEKLSAGFRGLKMEKKQNDLWVYYGR
ncbi:GNAT family N-acetyltransferase [Jeotgalibacillus sp. S-D1]|uniref:GNAT family N-acetyltransferase n=1 Tax=Jeotgalibacillus sp. S-D1 TaxID=2552189 RepID=UPI0010593D7B|nr:GNAT family N-acetyltransferase [Jeotgalibacillus sp. S-D1]TDL30804.1 GNAT family N-acetyltransferase [Jeotgalibacillus sp. S-D1]